MKLMVAHGPTLCSSRVWEHMFYVKRVFYKSIKYLESLLSFNKAMLKSPVKKIFFSLLSFLNTHTAFEMLRKMI